LYRLIISYGIFAHAVPTASRAVTTEAPHRRNSRRGRIQGGGPQPCRRSDALFAPESQSFLAKVVAGRHGEGAQQRNKEGRSLAHLGTPWSKTKLRSQSLERRSYPPLERRSYPRSRHDTRRRPHRAARRAAAGPPSKVGGISRPSVFAVLRLITNSNLVGCMTGRSAGFAPLRMRLA
jgi:hypothetical protein